ncbi:outer membrane lipoprotein-sorting protein [Candidatus Sulfurimonas marisnigri]|uniref:Outer membrane lipoprotein-sorting protein n=1 Tax=Candidatus Sulfurimonas marisnigri TaxID=2740405 RepID=A0A7S7M1F3_9BACT|nr:outer membrane lipoprotein-sorting protein [Candidatus Sulfurimonas marisnigri]QOY55255.1 outer membrane lipoprotein-sorting protein [Candidatus Sulfurimonas marisnigri]
MRKIFLILLAFAILLVADEAHEIMQKVDNNIRGKNIYMKISMKVVSLNHERNMHMETWSQGSKKSFVKVLYPPKDKGITFLSLDNQMWQYVPKIERTIKIPPSMMLQKWMGSDITNDDVVKQSSIVDDYNPKIVKRDGNIVTMELIPKDDAAVVWGKIVSQIDTSTYTSKKDIFYDEKGVEVRYFVYKNVKKFGEYYLPTYWRVESVDKRDNYTEMILEDVKYDIEISEKYFSKSALKRFSR